MILTGKQIFDIAVFAGLHVYRDMLNKDELETEYSLFDFEDEKYICLYEYPEEGSFSLGK